MKLTQVENSLETLEGTLPKACACLLRRRRKHSMIHAFVFYRANETILCVELALQYSCVCFWVQIQIGPKLLTRN